MICTSTLTAERARELLLYDGEILIWKQNRTGSARKGTAAGKLHHCGYRCVRIDGTLYYSHRVIWLIVHGQWPTHTIDHIDGNKLNNRIENLRDVTCSQNSKNLPKPKTNSSGTIGVYWRKDKQVWQAIIKANRKQIHLGFFSNKDDAINARKTAELQHGFHANHGR